MNAHPTWLADLWGLDLTRPRTRWAILRAGGWGGNVDKIIAWHDSECPQTGRPIKVPEYLFVERRRPGLGCCRGMVTCARLGCPETGECEGVKAEGGASPDVVALALGRRPGR